MNLDILGINISTGTVFTGAISGLGYALLAIGLLLVYRAARVLNFAHAQVGVLGALITAKLILDFHVPYWLGVVAGIAVGAGVSYLFDRFVIRKLGDRPKIVLMVATLGLSQVVVAVGNLLPPVVHAGPYPAAFSGRITLWGATITYADLTMLVVLVIVGLALTIFLGRTRFGIALLASSDNVEAARLAGVPVRRISSIVFTAVGGLAALTIILYSPVQGVSAGTGMSAQGTSILLMAFTAALAGGFWSLPRAAIAGVALGILEAIFYANTSSPGEVTALLFVVLVIVVIFTARRSKLGIDSASIAPASAPIARALDLSLWAKRLSITIAGALLVIGIVAPLIVGTASGQLTLIQIICYALAALSVCVITGWTGQISLGQFAFVGIGAYLTALLLNDGWNVFAAIGASIIAGGIAAGLLGIPALRARGMYLAVLTLSFAVAVQNWLLPSVILNPNQQTLVSAFAPDLFGISLSDPANFYYICLAAFVVVIFVLVGISRTGAGRALRAVRDNENAAASVGIWAAASKLKAFVLSGAIAALAGSLWGIGLGTFQATQFSADASISLVFMVVIGGIATLAGPVLAAIGIVGLPVLLGVVLNSLANSVQNLSTLLGAVGVMLAISKDPEGLGAGLLRQRQRILERLNTRWPSDKRKLVVADRLPRPARRVASETALRVADVTVAFGGVIANDHISFDVKGGSVTGLIGANGAGKSTLVNAISGAERSARGTVEMGGIRLDGLPAHKRARLGLARTFQNAQLYAGLTVSETIALAVESGRPASFVGSMLHLPGARRRDRQVRATADAIAASFGLSPWLDSLVNELSTGTRRIVEMASITARHPKVVLLDEPAAGVAQREVEQFGSLIDQITAETGASILLIEHDLPFVMGVSDRVVAMAEGKVIAEGSPPEVKADPAVIASYLGTDIRAVDRSALRRDKEPVVTTKSPTTSFELLWWSGCPSHDKAKAMLMAAMEKSGLDASSIVTRQIVTMDEAEAEHFIGSPTIRIGGVDIVPVDVDAPVALTCRLYFKRDGRPSPLPDVADIQEALDAISASAR